MRNKARDSDVCDKSADRNAETSAEKNADKTNVDTGATAHTGSDVDVGKAAGGCDQRQAQGGAGALQGVPKGMGFQSKGGPHPKNLGGADARDDWRVLVSDQQQQ